MKELIRKIIYKYIDYFILIGAKVHHRFPFEVLNSVCNSCAEYFDHVVSYTFRPRKSSQIYPLQIRQKTHPKTVVILQGPVRDQDNFTCETVKFYRINMPQAEIVVSTWSDTPNEQVELLEEAGAKVILSDLPEYNGLGNINYQVVSTKAGLDYAESIGAEYVLKTRTDQRLGLPFLLEYFFSLLSSFPLGSEFAYLHQKERIIAAQGTTGSTMFIPYFISDFYFFGRIKDVQAYFDYELQKVQMTAEQRRKYLEKIRKDDSVYEHHCIWAPEIMLAKNYISMKGTISIEDKVEAYWKFVKSNLIIVSHEDVQLFWPKYDKRKLDNAVYYNYYPGDSAEKCLIYNWKFTDWMNLYSGQIEYSEKYEEFVHRPVSIAIGSDID